MVPRSKHDSFDCDGKPLEVQRQLLQLAVIGF
jgi:hypothetical protein